MDFHPRRLLQQTKPTSVEDRRSPPHPCPPSQPFAVDPHPHPPSPPAASNQHTLILFILAAIGAVGFGIAYAFIAKYYFKRMAELRRRRRGNMNPPILFGPQGEEEEDFQDEEHGPIDHPIWYINTIGLQQSVIDSIAVFKYKRNEGLIEGTECSVCLSEFCEDESLRLLPKCSHAFHLPCIDTWLRSHKNCPLCRAPVLKESRPHDDHVVEESNANVSETQENMSEETIRDGSDTSSNPVDTPANSRATTENLKNDLSELVGNELLDKRVAMEEEMQLQPIRRSVSMNAPIGRIMDNTIQMKNSKASRDDDNRNKGSLSVHRSTRSYSFALSLQKGQISMKRSSSSGKIWSSRQWKSHNIPVSM